MDILEDESLLEEKELLTTIWTKPTLTFEFIFKYCPKKYVNYLLVIGGIVNAVDRNYQHFTENGNFSIINFIAIIGLGGLFGWIFSKIYASLLSWTGKWLNGKADGDQLTTVVAWATIPFICSSVLLIPRLLMSGDNSFSYNIQEQGISKFVAFVLIALIQLVLSCWSLVIIVKGIAVVQKFDTRKATLNAFLPLFVIVVPIILIAVIFNLIH